MSFRIAIVILLLNSGAAVAAQQSISLTSAAVTKYSSVRFTGGTGGYHPSYLPGSGHYHQISAEVRSINPNNTFSFLEGSSGTLTPTTPAPNNQNRWGLNSARNILIYQRTNPIFQAGGTENYLTFSTTGPYSGNEFEFRCTASYPGHPNITAAVTIGNYASIRCGHPLGTWSAWQKTTEAVGVTTPSATWNGMYEDTVTLEPGQHKRVIWGISGNSSARISSSLSGDGRNDVELTGQCNGVISPSDTCNVTMKNVSWHGTKNALLNFTVSLP